MRRNPMQLLQMSSLILLYETDCLLATELQCYYQYVTCFNSEYIIDMYVTVYRLPRRFHDSPACPFVLQVVSFCPYITTQCNRDRTYMTNRDCDPYVLTLMRNVSESKVPRKAVDIENNWIAKLSKGPARDSKVSGSAHFASDQPSEV